jgi:hypothetical protein
MPQQLCGFLCLFLLLPCAEGKQQHRRPGLKGTYGAYGAPPRQQLPAASVEYVKTVLDLGKRYADGVLIYCHQDPVRAAGKYNIIKAGFKKH